MVYLYVFLAVTAAALVYMRFEAGIVEVRRVRFTKSKKCLKVLQLSDIHIGRLKVSVKKIRDVIAGEKPDAIILTGDYIEKINQIPLFMKFLRDIGAGGNMYLCLGNHDYEAFKESREALDGYVESIRSTGINIMHNRCVCMEKNSKRYNIIGIADMRYSHHNLEEAFRDCCRDSFLSLGFSHNPDIVLEIPKGRLDYLLCGHFHGGQIWAPFDLEFKVMRNEKLCKMGIKSGLHKINGINLYINRGLGNVVFPLRFLSRPEITVFYFP